MNENHTFILVALSIEFEHLKTVSLSNCFMNTEMKNFCVVEYQKFLQCKTKNASVFIKKKQIKKSYEQKI